MTNSVPSLQETPAAAAGEQMNVPGNSFEASGHLSLVLASQVSLDHSAASCGNDTSGKGANSRHFGLLLGAVGKGIRNVCEEKAKKMHFRVLRKLAEAISGPLAILPANLWRSIEMPRKLGSTYL